MKLSPQRERFCRAYVANGGNATQAAKDAGYSPRTSHSQGQRLLKNVEIAEFIESLRKPLNEELGITAEWIRSRLKEEATLGRQKGGTQSGRIKALELLGKDVGMFSGEGGDDEDREWTIEIETVNVGTVDA